MNDKLPINSEENEKPRKKTMKEKKVKKITLKVGKDII